MSEFNSPKGFQFHPTHEELITFLSLQVNGDPLPWNGIVYKDLYGPNAPWVVFADSAVHRYWQWKNEGGATKSTTFVFTKLIRFPNSKRISRTAGGGRWSCQTGPKKIFSSDTDEVIGVMRMLSFKSPNSDGALPEFGHWIMHEYSLNETTNGAAATDLVVCKITRSVKNSGSSSSRRQPPLFYSPVIANGGSSECIQIPARKRAAEECSFQECKIQKLCDDGFAAEVKPPPQFSSEAIAYVEEVISCKEEKPGDDATFSEAAATGENDDSWLLEALQHNENTEPPYHGGGSGTAEGELDESWRSSLFEDFDNTVKPCGNLAQAPAEYDPLQVSAPPSPFEYDFSFDTDSLLDDVEPLWS